MKHCLITLKEKVTITDLVIFKKSYLRLKLIFRSKFSIHFQTMSTKVWQNLEKLLLAGNFNPTVNFWMLEATMAKFKSSASRVKCFWGRSKPTRMLHIDQTSCWMANTLQASPMTRPCMCGTWPWRPKPPNLKNTRLAFFRHHLRRTCHSVFTINNTFRVFLIKPMEYPISKSPTSGKWTGF